jgi:quercetin dioxygenase-like cupin family protein
LIVATGTPVARDSSATRIGISWCAFAPAPMNNPVLGCLSHGQEATTGGVFMSDGADSSPAFPHEYIGPAFERRIVTVAPGATRAYRESDWRDAIVLVERGEITLEYWEDDAQQFGSGAVIWLVGLQVRTLRNPGREPAVLVAVSRRDRGS